MLGQHASLQVDLSLEWLPMHENEILSKSEPLPKTSANSRKIKCSRCASTRLRKCLHLSEPHKVTLKNKTRKLNINKTEQILALV